MTACSLTDRCAQKFANVQFIVQLVVEDVAGVVPRATIKISGPLVAPKIVQYKAVTCQNFEKACSAFVVILMLSCFVTF